MSKTKLFRIAKSRHQAAKARLEANRQAALIQAEAMAETARKSFSAWADMEDEQADDMHRRLFDIGYWEEGDDSIIL